MPTQQKRALTAQDIPDPIRELFEAKRQSGAPDDCWPWPNNGKGYGQMTWIGPDGRWRQEKTHRMAVALSGRDIPPGMLVCHTCDWPPCCNPAHLFIGTHHDNHWDMRNKGRWPVARQPRPRPTGEAHHVVR